jgi:ABC-2 type transport system permease protein
MVGLMIGVVLLGSFMDWYYDRGTPEGAWREDVTEQKMRNVAALNDPKIHEENKKYLQERIQIADYRLEHDIRTESATIWSGINDSAEMVVLITLFTVIVAGDSLAGEFSTGTIKLLLIRPMNRLKVLLSKYIAMLKFGILLLIILFVVSLLFNGLLYNFQHMDLKLVEVNSAGQVVERNMFANLWQSYLLNCVSTIMFVTMAFMISSAFRSSALAIGFSIFALFAGFLVNEIIQRYSWAKYVLFPNLDLSQYLAGRPYQEGMTMGFSIAVLAVYFIIFNLVSYIVFTRRDVAS